MMLDWHDHLAKEHQEALLREAEKRRIAKILAASRREKGSSLWDGLPSWPRRWLLKGGTGAVREGCCEPWAPYEEQEQAWEPAASPRSGGRCSA